MVQAILALYLRSVRRKIIDLELRTNQLRTGAIREVARLFARENQGLEQGIIDACFSRHLHYEPAENYADRVSEVIEKAVFNNHESTVLREAAPRSGTSFDSRSESPASWTRTVDASHPGQRKAYFAIPIRDRASARCFSTISIPCLCLRGPEKTRCESFRLRLFALCARGVLLFDI
jgi:hypothetical protein